MKQQQYTTRYTCEGIRKNVYRQIYEGIHKYMYEAKYMQQDTTMCIDGYMKQLDVYEAKAIHNQIYGAVHKNVYRQAYEGIRYQIYAARHTKQYTTRYMKIDM